MYSPGYPCCCGGGGEEDCPNCDDGAPTQYQVVLSGIDDADCTVCDHPTQGYNDTWVLDWVGYYDGGASIPYRYSCVWEYDLGAEPCSASSRWRSLSAQPEPSENLSRWIRSKPGLKP